MNKHDLIRTIAAKAGITPAQADSAIIALVESLSADLAAGNSTTIANLGVFKTIQRAPRKGRNLLTGEPVEIPSHRAVRFVPAKGLKERMVQ